MDNSNFRSCIGNDRANSAFHVKSRELLLACTESVRGNSLIVRCMNTLLYFPTTTRRCFFVGTRNRLICSRHPDNHMKPSCLLLVVAILVSSLQIVGQRADDLAAYNEPPSRLRGVIEKY